MAKPSQITTSLKPLKKNKSKKINHNSLGNELMIYYGNIFVRLTGILQFYNGVSGMSD